MEYKVVEFKNIHWDGVEDVNPDTDNLQYGLEGEICSVKNEKQPIVIVCKIRVFRKEAQIFGCMYQAKCLLTYEDSSEHYNDIVRFLNSFLLKVNEQWNEKIVGTPLEGASLIVDPSSDATRSLSIQIWEQAKSQQLF